MNRNSLVLVAALLVCVVQGAAACRCIQKTLRQQFYAPGITRVVSGKVIDVRSPCPGKECSAENQNKKAFFKISVGRVYKGCAKPTTFWVSSFVGSSLCGVKLQLGKIYVLTLSEDAVPMINSCQHPLLVSDLTEDQTSFLNNRYVCCGEDSCHCADHSPVTNCFVAPCSVSSPPCKEATVCRDNYCGGCLDEWFSEDGAPACEQISP